MFELRNPFAIRSTLAAALVLVLPMAASAASSPAETCEASKSKIAGTYYSCRQKAEAKSIRTGAPADYSKCTVLFNDKWDGAEATGAGACPDIVLTADMNSFLADQAAQAAAVIAGGVIPAVCGDGVVGTGEDCEDGNLAGATCAGQPGFVGGTLACAAGCTFDTSNCYASRFVDTGLTIIDNETGLEWEKKDSSDGVSNPANPHDVDNTYTWGTSLVTGAPDGTVFTDFLRSFNRGQSADSITTTNCFAGHCDWRLPTIQELKTLINPGAGSPPWAYPELLPTLSAPTWTQTEVPAAVAPAWAVNFNLAAFTSYNKTFSFAARAVRSSNP